MRKLIIATLIAFGCAVALLAQSPTYLVTGPSGSVVPLATTSELTHGATAPTWTAVVGSVPIARASASAPSAVTADQPVADWAALDGARARWMVAEATGGATPNFYVSTASNNSTNIKASAGQVYSITVVNVTASLKYIRLYNLSSAPTCTSSTGIVFYSPIPGSTTNPTPLEFSVAVGRAFSAGIGFCITGAAGVTDNTSTAAGDVILNYAYK